VERVADRRPVPERQGRLELAVNLGEQHGRRWHRRAVERCQAQKCPIVVGVPRPDHDLGAEVRAHGMNIDAELT